MDVVLVGCSGCFFYGRRSKMNYFRAGLGVLLCERRKKLGGDSEVTEKGLLRFVTDRIPSQHMFANNGMLRVEDHE